MKLGIRGQLTDVITCVKFLVDRFRGYGVLTPPKLPFPIDLLRRPYNSVALPCDTVIKKTIIEETLSYFCCRTTLQHCTIPAAKPQVVSMSLPYEKHYAGNDDRNKKVFSSWQKGRYGPCQTNGDNELLAFAMAAVNDQLPTSTEQEELTCRQCGVLSQNAVGDLMNGLFEVEPRHGMKTAVHQHTQLELDAFCYFQSV